ncbi:MAG: hypothetical protein HS111_20000 [Kofleriaceae bacterium]|nr:hypothetical protein [Kofleriaceae bacterium]MCL4225219.1 hypothetical protein [Myxococcales bacterium]
MPTERIVTNAPISNPEHPIWDQIDLVLERLAAAGIRLELDEHPPILGFELLAFGDHRSGTWFLIWEDYRAKVKFVEITSPDVERLAVMRAAIHACMDVPSRAQLLARARRGRSNPDALMRIVYAAGDAPDPDTFALVTAALSHQDAYMRDIATYGVSILGWPGFEDSLRTMLERESTPSVADHMRQTIATLGRSGRPLYPII